MLIEVSGDILLTGAHAIAHGVAPNDNFHQGLALALREEYPAMYKDFRHYCQQSHPKAGGLWVWAGAKGVRVVGLLTQDEAPSAGAHPGKATTHNVNLALKALRALVQEEAFESLALPRLATGVGGLAWDDVRPLIERHLGDLEIPVYVYTTFRPGVKAKE
ncbi:MAG TPA: macro domain-containing protein [Pseudomonadales bacterium]|jgi:O-acetyl-ADP-ribose deacetylase (regulator of RNase III)|nr:macro domain-containing protein [Pseudomonadales bacterium]